VDGEPGFQLFGFNHLTAEGERRGNGALRGVFPPALAERVLPRAADVWVQASLEQRQRFQQLFFPDGISFDGNGFVGTRATAPAFSYLRAIEVQMKGWWT
jgi:hypothetical protein